MKIPDDYVDVAERIRQFKERYPEGTLQHFVEPYFETAGDRTFVVYSAAAYRTPDDPRPGIGWAWEPVPGPTPFTKDSELMNAETSAWGRAIVALGFETKKIASAEELRNRQSDENAPEKPAKAKTAADGPMTEGQKSRINEMLEALEKEMPSTLRAEDWLASVAEWTQAQWPEREKGAEMSKAQANLLIAELESWLIAEQNERAGAKA